MIGEIGEGVPRALESITALRLRAPPPPPAAAARWTLDYALAQARRPHRSGMPLGEREQVQAMLGQSAMDLFAARAALYAAARAAESGDAPKSDVAMAKAVATEAVAHIVDRAMQLSAGRRWWRGIRWPACTVAFARGASPRAPRRSSVSPWPVASSPRTPQPKETPSHASQ